MFTSANFYKASENGGYFGSHHLILQKYYENMIFLLQIYICEIKYDIIKNTYKVKNRFNVI